MNSKIRTYFLLILVIGVWGIILYRVIAVVNPSTPEIVLNDFNLTFTPDTAKPMDTFSIQLSDRDPFLGTRTSKKKTSLVSEASSPKVVWAPILYHGCISKNASKVKVFIISIDGKQYLMKMGQIIDGVKLIWGNINMVTLDYKGSRKTVKKA